MEDFNVANVSSNFLDTLYHYYGTWSVAVR